MALRSGLAGQIGIGEESTYGTRVTPTRFLEGKEEIALTIERMEAFGLRASTGAASGTVMRTDRWAAGRRHASGSLTFDGDNSIPVASKGFSMLYKHIMGGAPVITTPGGGTLSRDHTFALADPFGLSLTVQVGTPDVGGTIRVREYEGGKVMAAEWACDTEGWLGLTLDADFEDESLNQSLASASYPTSQEPYHWGQAAHTIGGGAVDVFGYSLRLERSLANERFRQAGTTLKKEPIMNGEVVISGSLELEYGGLTEYNRYINGTIAALVSTWTGSIIEAAIANKLVHTLNDVRWDEPSGPNLTGPDLVTFTAPFKAMYDGTDQPFVPVLTTTDTAV